MTLKNLMTPFSRMAFNCLKAAELLLGDSLLFTSKSSGVHEKISYNMKIVIY